MPLQLRTARSLLLSPHGSDASIKAVDRFTFVLLTLTNTSTKRINKCVLCHLT